MKQKLRLWVGVNFKQCFIRIQDNDPIGFSRPIHTRLRQFAGLLSSVPWFQPDRNPLAHCSLSASHKRMFAFIFLVIERDLRGKRGQTSLVRLHPHLTLWLRGSERERYSLLLYFIGLAILGHRKHRNWAKELTIPVGRKLFCRSFTELRSSI